MALVGYLGADGSTSSGSASTLTVEATFPAGSRLIVAAFAREAQTSALTIADDRGLSWTSLAEADDSRGRYWAAVAPGGLVNITVTRVTTTLHFAVAVFGYEPSTVGGVSSATPPTSGGDITALDASVTTTAADSTVVSILTARGPEWSPTTSGYTEHFSISTGSPPPPDPDPEPPPPDPDPEPTFPANPGVVVDGVRLASIDYTTSPWQAGYNKIINESSSTTTALRSWYRYSASNYTPFQQGTRILGGGEVPAGASADACYLMCRDDGVAAAVQAYLWPITGAVSRRNKAIEILNAYRDVTSFGPGGFLENTPYKPLAAGLGMEGFVQALSVVGEFEGRDELVANFVEYWYPSLWHVYGGNWLSTFAAARLGIAVAAADTDLWDHAKAYYDVVIKANIWLTSDGALVGELPRNETTNAAPAGSNYPGHWWNAVPTNRSSANLTNGQYCEKTRNSPAHTQMGLNGTLSGALTIEHQGDDGLDTYGDRIIAAYESAAADRLAELDASQEPGGGWGWRNGWTPALATFGPTEVPNVAELCTRSTDISVPATANNHIMQGLIWPVGT